MDIKILVIDDFIAAAEMLALVMEIKGYEVRKAFNGMAALKEIEHFIPDIVLCDINMPHIQGDELCKKMREDPRLKETIFIAQTAVDLVAGKQLIASAGFHHHLVKPIDVGVLDAIIKTHFGEPFATSKPPR